MGSGIQKKMKKSALERITSLERALGETIGQVNQTLTFVGEKIREIDQRFYGLLRVLGVEMDSVNDAIKAIRLERITAQVAAAQAALEAGIASGDIVETDVVTEKSLIVGREMDNDLNEIPPGRAQILVETMHTEQRAELVGKGVGTIISITPKAKLEVQRIFNMVVKAEEEAEANIPDNE